MLMPIPKSNASAGLLAWIATSKYCDALPLYRQESIFTRFGIDMSRTTMARWMIEIGDIFTPLVELIKSKIFASGVCHADETTVQVLKEKGRPADKRSYKWVVSSGKFDTPAVFFEYQAGRTAKVASEFLRGFQGRLMTDGYAAYSQFSKSEKTVHLAWWAHSRRKFDEALGMSSEERQSYRQTYSVPIIEKYFEWINANRHSVPP
jgi:transposase